MSVYAAVLLCSVQLSVTSGFHSFSGTEIKIFCFVTPAFPWNPFWRSVRHLFRRYQCCFRWKVMHCSWAVSYFRSFGSLSSGCRGFFIWFIRMAFCADKLATVSEVCLGRQWCWSLLDLPWTMFSCSACSLNSHFNVFQLHVCCSYDTEVFLLGKNVVSAMVIQAKGAST